MDGYLPVKVLVPLDEYRRLHAEAQQRQITVAERIAQRIALPAARKQNTRIGRPSAYTTAKGEEIAADRRFGKSWNEIGRVLGIAGHTAKDWHSRYQDEVREQNMRDRAERNAS